MSHIDDTSQLTRKLLLYMDLGLANNEIQLIAEAAKYHDIGKIYIPDHILYKPGELTKEEYKIVQQHTVIGHDMIMNSNLNRELKKYAAEIAYTIMNELWIRIFQIIFLGKINQKMDSGS